MTTRYSEFQTTNEHTFTAPQRMPGYGGHCPEVNYSYGDTYGSTTASFFHDYQQRHLSGWRGGDHRLQPFPAVYNAPSAIASTRDRSRARWLSRVPAYDVSYAGQKQKDVLDFDRKCHEHREWYRDRSNTCPRVMVDHVPLGDIAAADAVRQWKAPARNLFSSQNTDGRLGVSELPLVERGLSPRQRSLQYSNRMQSGRDSSSSRPKSGRYTSATRPMSTRRQRAMRDDVFENRVGYE